MNTKKYKKFPLIGWSQKMFKQVTAEIKAHVQNTKKLLQVLSIKNTCFWL
jgi:hypothetical protein